MDNGIGYDDIQEQVRVSPSGRKSKRKPEEYSRQVAKRLRHSASGKSPAIACRHDKSTSCQAATVSEEDIYKTFTSIYSMPKKENQDASLLAYMDISTVKRRRSKELTPRKRNMTVKYNIQRENGERVQVCKETFMSITCELH